MSWFVILIWEQQLSRRNTISSFPMRQRVNWSCSFVQIALQIVKINRVVVLAMKFQPIAPSTTTMKMHPIVEVDMTHCGSTQVQIFSIESSMRGIGNLVEKHVTPPCDVMTILSLWFHLLTMDQHDFVRCLCRDNWMQTWHTCCQL